MNPSTNEQVELESVTPKRSTAYAAVLFVVLSIAGVVCFMVNV